ncbi:segregation and condensation protein B [Arthrobacter pityocampae]|uniref:Segregation and condensation protein B n=1 Tax=Arthrobacter pityocampae TaxID=547334 RepID=A0A2S5J0F9_9MICC|nr:SMC-Scp complex subunit ScpB [Arthrobacter pityocampae]PPB50271.1 segregation and condensation protein B [Arthrobacter pityocampae]
MNGETAPDGEGIPVEDLPGGLRAAVEAILMVADRPVTGEQVAAALDRPDDAVHAVLMDLQQEYDGYTGSGSQGAGHPAPRGFELRNIAGGWRIFSRKHFASVVADFVLDGQSARLSQAALETLAVIAYRQPVSRARVSAIRGVNVDSVVRTLLQRGLVAELETEPETGAVLHGTTTLFLERLGLGSVDELPRIAPHLPGLESLGEYDETTY